MNELRVATIAEKCLWIDYDSVTMSKYALGIWYESRPIFESGNSWPKFWTVQNFWAEFPIDLGIARTDYGLCESVKIFTNWVRFWQETKYLSIRGNAWVE